MENIKINLGSRSYKIHIGSGLLTTLDVSQFKASSYTIITDSNIKKLFGQALKKRLEAKGIKIDLIEIPSGENSKSWEIVKKIVSELARKNTDKNALIIALGGGVVGDLAGFVASIYKRGIRYIHIPTTLLAQVDSSIGGKTGINIPEGKNLVGAVYQPQAVIIDTDVLKKLPEKEIKNGLAEVIKYGVIWDKTLFSYLETYINNRDEEFYLEIIKKSVLIKSQIVEQDEHEKELRKTLNYGHTVGHAIEILSKYKLTHGEAVAIGMVYEGNIAVALDILSQSELERQNSLIKKARLPMSYDIEVDKLIRIMKRDKKSKGDAIYFVLPEKIGKVKAENGRVAFPVSDKIIRNCLK